MAKLTIRDIARLAGVGKSTVSRVLNNEPVKKETRQKIEAVMHEYDYQPSQAAIALNKQEIKSIGVIVSSLNYESETSSLSEIITYFEKLGYESVILDSRRCKERFGRHVQFLKQKRVDGLLYFGFDGIEELSFTEPELKGNIVCLATPSPHVTCVAIDTKKAVDICFDHLFQTCHKRKIGFICVEESDYFSGKARKDAYLDKCVQHNIEPVVIGDMSSYADGRKAFLQLKEEGADAIICGTEVLGAGALLEALRTGSNIAIATVGISEQIQLLDNYSCAAKLLHPEVGLNGAQRLHQLIQGEKPGKTTLIEPELIVRTQKSI